MNIPSFVGPVVSSILFLMTVFGFCFYYCYWKPKRQRKKNAECAKSNTSNPASPSLTSRSHSAKRGKKTCSYDEEFCYGSGLSPYSVGYCVHGGLPMAYSTCHEQRWQPPKMKYQMQCKFQTKIEKCRKPKACCEIRDDVTKELAVPKPCISRQFSTESRTARQVCHLKVIQECEEEKEEIEEVCEANKKDLETEE